MSVIKTIILIALVMVVADSRDIPINMESLGLMYLTLTKF
jgi:hypothetical protein